MIRYKQRHPGLAKLNVPQYDPANPPPQKAVALGGPRLRPPPPRKPKKPMRVLTRNG